MLTQIPVSKLLKFLKSSRFLCSFALLLIAPALLADKSTKQGQPKTSHKIQFSNKPNSNENRRPASANPVNPRKRVCAPWPY